MTKLISFAPDVPHDGVCVLDWYKRPWPPISPEAAVRLLMRYVHGPSVDDPPEG